MANPTDPTKSSLAHKNTPTASAAEMWLLQRLTAAELSKQGPPLNGPARATILRLWHKTLSEIGEDRFDAALDQELQSSVFRPDIANIRRFAGLTTVPPIEAEATAALHWLITAQRIHKRLFGIRYGHKQPDGSFKFDREGNDVLQPPAIPPHTRAALESLGFGSVQEGLNVVWTHPSLDEVRLGEEMDNLRMTRGTQAAERIERKWKEAYIGAASV